MPLRIGKGVLNRQPHIGHSQLSQDGAVCELYHRVDDALRLNDDFDAVIGHVKQPVRFDDFQAFIEHRRRVNRNLAAHIPCRMLEALLYRNGREFFQRPVKMGAA